LLYPIHLIGILGLIISLVFFFSGFNIFKSYAENPVPTSPSDSLIKTGIFAYTRNPIYLSFVLFHLSMFLVFENVMYLLSSIGQAIWIHNYIIKYEEEYLLGKFTDEYQRYMNAVSRWLFF
jgi:protein-S-isoprenylcysteine O-methyltransferase Ste14